MRAGATMMAQMMVMKTMMRLTRIPQRRKPRSASSTCSCRSRVAVV